MNKDEGHEEYSHRQASRNNISASDDRSDHAAVANIRGIDSIYQDTNTSPTATQIATTATNQAGSLTCGGTVTHSSLPQDAAFLPSHDMNERPRIGRSGSNSDDSSSLGDKSFDSIVTMLTFQEGDQDGSIARANMNFQTPASMHTRNDAAQGGQQGEASTTTMAANLLAHFHQDQTVASKVWPALYAPSTFPPGAGGTSSNITGSSPSWSSAGGGSDTASNRTDMATVVAAIANEDHVAIKCFNSMVGRDVVGETFDDLFRQQNSLLIVQPSWGTSTSPRLGVTNFLIDGKTACKVHVKSVYSDLKSADQGLLYFVATILSENKPKKVGFVGVDSQKDPKAPLSGQHHAGGI